MSKKKKKRENTKQKDISVYRCTIEHSILKLIRKIGSSNHCTETTEFEIDIS